MDSYYSGNKYRKLFYYLMLNPFEFKDIISYGGIQSNAMLSIAALAFEKEVPFTYYTRYLPAHLSENIESNYTKALALGMHIELLDADSDEDLGRVLREKIDKKSLFIPQGGASRFAKVGVMQLAQEILAWRDDKQIENLVVATPSGTGTTALWLDEALFSQGIEVLTTPCVGDIGYLNQQIALLRSEHHLRVLKTKKKYRFAKPSQELLSQYQNFLDEGIEFDLIYAPVMWQALEENRDDLVKNTLLYVHSGGVIGNPSQRLRYKN